MSDNLDISSILKKALNEVPEDIKNAAPAAISSATSLLESTMVYVSKHQPLKSMHGYITTTNSTTEANAVKIFDECAPEFPDILCHREKCISIAKSANVADQELVSCVEGCMQKCANQALIWGFSLSLVGLIIEACRLHEFWEEIRNANTFVEKDFDRMKADIQAKIDQLPDKINLFADGLQESEFSSKGPNQRVLFLVRKTRERDALTKVIKGIHGDIGNLKCEVNGKMECLRSYRKATLAPAIAHTFQSLTLGVNIIVFGAVASPFLVALTSFAVVANLATAGTGLYLKHSAGLTVEELRKKLWEVDQLRGVVNELQDKLILVFEEFEDIMEELSRDKN